MRQVVRVRIPGRDLCQMISIEFGLANQFGSKFRMSIFLEKS